MKRTFLLKSASISIGVLLSLIIIEIFLRSQNFVELSGFNHQHPWNKILHHGSDQFVVTNYGSDCNGERKKILLLGDSWMEDEHLADAISKEFASKSGECIQAINGGTSSYAPTLYLLKGRQAFKKYGNFDYIVVNVDETDVGDEWLRYRIPTVRDNTGKIVAVPFNNDLESRYIWNGKLWAEDSDYYIVRLVKFAFFYKVLVPMLYKLTYAPDYSSLMRYVFAPDARSLYKKELKHFDHRLLKMATKLTRYTSDARHVYVTHHPHLRGLVRKVSNGHLYLPIVSEALARLHRESGVTVLDARDHVRQIHGDAFPDRTFAPGDPFSHLTAAGASRYGKWIGDQMVLKALPASNM
jgi:hypothetical protein